MILGVNIDHIATIREARKGAEPDPVMAATLATLNFEESIHELGNPAPDGIGWRLMTA